MRFRYLLSMRGPIALALVLVPGLAMADRLISVPIGRKIPFGTVRMEVGEWGNANPTFETYLATGIDQYFDLEFRTWDAYQERLKGTFDVSYNFIAPVADFTPGFSVGMLDLQNNTFEGRRAYFATTIRQTFSTPNGDEPFDFTLGLTIGRKHAPFVGLNVPLISQVRLLAEHDGFRPAAAIEVRPIKPLAMRLGWRGDQRIASVSYTVKF